MTKSVPAFRYCAFISYSHRDEGVARWLQARLEGYRFPAGAKRADGDAPARLWPIFRDREELRAGPSLSESLQEALRASKAQIVICSPAAAVSPWVEKEVLFYQSLGRREQILALVAAGDPGAPAGAPDCCVPRSLLAQGPDGTASFDVLAADLRRGADGRRLALLKIIAGLADVPLAELVRRDQQRAITRLRWMVAGALVLMLAFAGLGMALDRQKKEALRQRDLARQVRDQAQELNTFFITDLRQKLRGVGRLDLLEEATQRVLAYHRALPAELANDAAVINARAVAMDYVGQLTMVKGDAAEAVRLLKEAQALWLSLAERAGAQGKGLEGYAINCKMLSEAYGAGGEVTQEVEALRSGVEKMSSLRAKTPEGEAEKDRYLCELLTGLGRALYQSGDAKGALQALDEAAAKGESVTEKFPKDARNWLQASRAFADLANFYRQIDDLPVAQQQAESAVVAAQALVKMDVENATGWEMLAHTWSVKYDILLVQKQWPEAEAAAREHLDWRERLSRRDVENPSHAAAEANAHDDLANVLNRQGKIEEALKEFQQAVALLTDVIRRHPTRTDWKADLAVVLRRRGDVAFDSEVWDLALADYNRSLKMRQELVNGAPENIRLQLRLADTQLACGEVLWKLKRWDEAQAAFTAAQKITQLESIPQNDVEAQHIRESTERALRDLGQARPK